MPDTLPDPNSNHTLKEQYVPFEKRGSQHVDWKPFVYDTIKFFVVTKLASLAGYFAGKSLAGKNIRLGPITLDAQWGAVLGGFAGAMYEAYHHWHKSEGQRLGVKNISGDLRTAIDPAQLEKESTKEEAIIHDLKKLDAALSEQKSHRGMVAARREEASPEAGVAV